MRFIVVVTILLLNSLFSAGVNAGFLPEFELGGKSGVSSGQTFNDSMTEMEFIFVKGGCYEMGSNHGDPDEKPVHEVCVDDFWMGKYEVTQKQWRTIMGNNPSSFNGNERPVERVSWLEINDYYLPILNRKSGKKYRLPTEAEWEYAARSGGKNVNFVGTDELVRYAWNDNNSEGTTHPVGRKQPNDLGLYDMMGNVWEWVSDWYSDIYYNQSPRTNPQGSSSELYRVFRGGSWRRYPGSLRATLRNKEEPSYRYNNLGFRLVLPIEKQQR